MWQPVGECEFTADLPETINDSHDTLFKSARTVLEAAGWTTDNWLGWDAVDTGYVLTVTKEQP